MEVTKDYRPDCHAQTALMFYLYSLYTKDLSWEKRAHNLLNYLFENGYQDTDENSRLMVFGYGLTFLKNILKIFLRMTIRGYVLLYYTYINKQEKKNIKKEA